MRTCIPIRGSILLTAALAGPIVQQAMAQQETASQLATVSPSGSSDSRGIVLKKTVHNVVLDVVVTDGNEKPVVGLRPQDFSVLEDGNAQRILAFETHDFAGKPDFVPPKLPELPPNTFVNFPSAPERGPLNVILYDMLNTSMDEQIYARAELVRFLQSKAAGARFAVFVLYDELKLIQGFTADTKQLLAVANSRTMWPRAPAQRGDSLDYRTFDTLNAFLSVGRFLAGLPGHKNLIWVSSAFPSAFLTIDDQKKPDAKSSGNRSDNDALKAITDTLAEGQIAVYPVDVRGLVGWSAGGNYGLLYRNYATEDELADLTGGHAFYSQNDVNGAIRQAVENGSTYYSLSYAPTNQKYDGKLRKIEVKLLKSGYHLAYRRSYYGDDLDSKDPQALAARVPDPLSANLQHGAPMTHDVFFSAHVVPLDAPAKATNAQLQALAQQPAFADTSGKHKQARLPRDLRVQPFEVDYSVPVRQFKQQLEQSGSQVADLEFAVAAYDVEGKMLNSIVQPIQHATDDQSPLQGNLYRVRQHIAVPVKAASIRMTVRDVATGRIGALEVSLPLAPEPEDGIFTPTTSSIRVSGEAPLALKPN